MVFWKVYVWCTVRKTSNCEIKSRFTRHITGLLAVFTVYEGSQNSIVSVVTHYGQDTLGIESCWGQDFPCYPDWPWGHTTSCTMGTGSFTGLKRLQGRADHSPPSVRLQMGWSYTSTSPLCLDMSWGDLPAFEKCKSNLNIQGVKLKVEPKHMAVWLAADSVIDHQLYSCAYGYIASAQCGCMISAYCQFSCAVCNRHELFFICEYK